MEPTSFGLFAVHYIVLSDDSVTMGPKDLVAWVSGDGCLCFTDFGVVGSTPGSTPAACIPMNVCVSGGGEREG